MAKKLTFFLFFLTFIITSSISAIDNYVSFEKIIDNSENYSFIEPILDAQKELNGFIYSDTVNNQIVIERFDRDSLIILEIDKNPANTAHFFSADYDTLFCFATYEERDIHTTITKFTISDYVASEDLDFYCYYFTDYFTFEIKYHSLKLEDDIQTGRRQLIFNKRSQFTRYIQTYGPQSKTVMTSAIIDPYTLELVIKKPEQKLIACPLTSTSEPNYITFSNIHYFYDFRNYPDDTATGSSNTTYLDIFDNNLNPVFEFQSESSFTDNIFLGNFKPSTDDNELIYSGYGQDLANYYANRVKHIACYSYSSGFPDEVWYNDEVDEISFEYVYKAKDYLVGRRGNNEVIFLDYLNGNIEDSTNLSHELNNPIFFESYDALNLFGLAGDTIFIHRLDVPTFITSYSEEKEEIPLTYTLFQNHPNPFNGETRIEFNVDETDNFTLKIYNVLGQEIKHLAGGVFAPGVYQFYWNGKNESGLEQSSGIYFARLQAEQNSQMIKLIYIK